MVSKKAKSFIPLVKPPTGLLPTIENGYDQAQDQWTPEKKSRGLSLTRS
jgi:hypothetical protein